MWVPCLCCRVRSQKDHSLGDVIGLSALGCGVGVLLVLTINTKHNKCVQTGNEHPVSVSNRTVLSAYDVQAEI